MQREFTPEDINKAAIRESAMLFAEGGTAFR